MSEDLANNSKGLQNTKDSSTGIRKKKKGEIDISRFQRVSIKDKIIFTHNIQIMLRTGLSLSAALKTLALQTDNLKFSKILSKIHENVDSGTAFSDALRKYPEIFNELFISMVESGELSGNLDGVFKYLHTQMKKDYELVAKVRGAMIYPAIVVIAMLGIGTAMMIFVIPKLINIFDEFQAELPLPTKILISSSKFLTSKGLILLILGVIFIFGIRHLNRKELGKKIFHKIYLKLPILSGISRKINIARFARTFSSLIKTDIPVVKSLEITSSTVGNYFFSKALLKISEDIKKGISISESLSKYPNLFPPMVIQMVTVGEESGEVDEVLIETANFYEEEIDQIMKNLPQIIEPVLILVLGAGVGGMAVSIIMPLYSITQNI